jgi:WD40 repeat protein
MKTIFISYSRTDAEPASFIAEKLHENYDIDVFIDYQRLRAGERWPIRLAEEIKTREYFLVLVSSRSMKSRWVNREINFADAHNKIIIPVILEPADPNLVLQEIEHVDFQRWNVDKQVNDALLKLAISMELQAKKREQSLPDQAIEPQQSGESPMPDEVKFIDEPAVVEENVDQLFRDAANLEAKQPAQAYIIYRHVQEINPADMDSGTRRFLGKKLEELKSAYLESLLERAQDSMQAGKWEQAIQLCQEVLSQDKNHAQATQIIQTAQKNLECQPLYERAILASKAGQWNAVVTFLKSVKESCPDFGHPARPLINGPLETNWVDLLAEVASCRHKKQISSIAFSPDGKLLASLQYSEQNGGKITIWKIPGGKKLTEIQEKAKFNTILCFSPDGSRLAGLSEDYSICLWDTSTGEQVAVLENKVYNFADLAFLPDGNSLVTVSSYGSAKLWDLSGKELPFSIDIDIYSAAAFSQDGTLVAFDDTRNTVSVWNIPDERELVTFLRDGWFFDDSDDEVEDEDTDNNIEIFKFSPTGNYLAAVTYGGTIKVWNLIEGKELDLSFNSDSPIRSVHFSQDGDLLALQSEGDKVRIWNLKTGRKVLTLLDSSGSVALSPNGNILACTIYKGLQLWSVPDGEELVSIEGHSQYVSEIAFSPGGNLIATTSQDKKIKLWGI